MPCTSTSSGDVRDLREKSTLLGDQFTTHKTREDCVRISRLKKKNVQFGSTN